MSISSRRCGAVARLALVAALAACGRGAAQDGAAAGGEAASAASGTSAVSATSVPGHAMDIKTQAPHDPCGWVSAADAAKALGEPLLHAPTRVRSADNTVTQANGDACLYELRGDSLFKRLVSIEVTADDQGAMQAGFSGLGNPDLANGSAARGDSLIDGRWDWVSGLPGGLVMARAGRIAVQVFAPMGLQDKGMQLAAAVMDRIPDVPFVTDAADLAVPPEGRDPCALITRQEAEAAIGPLTVAPYRSRPETALAYGSGSSCSYFTGKHRALVVTSVWDHGAMEYKMLAGVSGTIASKVGGGAAAPDTLDGPWDQISTGMDGSVKVLTGDRMLGLQYLAGAGSQAHLIGAARAAVPRLKGAK